MPLLSCQQCQRRKRKCDKQLPACSECVKAEIECTVVQRHRLPRGRSSRREAQHKDLRVRIEKLEAVLSTLEHGARRTHQSRSAPKALERTTLDSFVASEFWEELSETIAGMREVLETSRTPQESEDAHDATMVGDAHHLDNLPPYLFSTYLVPLSSENPFIEEELFLFDTYRVRVDPIFKLLHWPSTVVSLGMAPRPCNRNLIDAADLKALRFAIYFAAMCSLHPHERGERSIKMDHCRQMIEGALAHANLFATTSLVTLQALVIYLAGLRACQANAQQWTLIAVAIRIASAQGIPTHFNSKGVILDDQLKRRLWCCIGLLDMQSAFDRGSNPLLQSDDLLSPPYNISDDGLHLEPDVSVLSKDRFTDMSFSLLAHRAGYCQRRLTELGVSAASGTHDPYKACHEQLTELADFERHVKQIVESCEYPPTTIQAFTQAVGEESLVAMRLLLHRPLHRRGQMSAFTTYTKACEFDILTTATEVLERSQYKRNEGQFAQWAWFSWVKWYALAVVLAELCAIDNSFADHAWEVAQRSYEDYADAVADAKSGLLWKPIAKLMLKVKQLRQHGAVSSMRAPDEACTMPMTSAPTVIDAVTDLHSIASLDVAQTRGLDSSSEFLQASHEAIVTQPTSEELSWIQWDMLIDDIENANILNEDPLTGLEPWTDQSR